MTDDLDRLQAALAGRYVIERELGRGGMATVYQRLAPSRPRCSHQPARPASQKPGGDDISLTLEF